MSERSNKNRIKNRRLDPMIVVALIGLVGTIIAALIASPLLERWLSRPSPTPETISPSASATTGGTQTPGNRIGLKQTVTGTLTFSEAAIWIFNEGPANVTIVLDVGPFGSALIILKDPGGVVRAYVDQQIRQGVTQLVNFSIPTSGDYTIWVRNQANEPADYTLTVQDALTPPPP